VNLQRNYDLWQVAHRTSEWRTIHPVIELKVGHYRQNKQLHRICEMHQDAYIWQRMGIGRIGNVERMSRHLLHCSDFQSKSQIDHSIEKLWRESLIEVYSGDFYNGDYCIPDYCIPDIHAWFTAFTRVIELVEDEYRLFPFSRHVAAFLNLVYPEENQIDSTFIEKLPTPHGLQHYDQIFDYSLEKIMEYQILLGQAVYENGETHWLKNWSLDTGLCDHNGELSMWQHAGTTHEVA
jgi:hypothetical protein